MTTVRKASSLLNQEGSWTVEKDGPLERGAFFYGYVTVL